MKNSKLSHLVCAVLLCAAAAAHAGPVVTSTTNAATLASAIAGNGITLSNVSLNSNASKPAGTFTGGASTVGFDSGIVLTTGTTNCVAGPNTVGNCTGTGSSTSLKFDFNSTTGNVFFRYVFASEEFTDFAPSDYNDKFELRLDGVNIATLPGGLGPVTINNINCLTNSSYYRNNVSGEDNQPTGCTNLGLDIQYDGLTTVLLASSALAAGTHSFEFFITDVGDSSLDSAVFIQAGSFSGTNPAPVPEPASLALVALGLTATGALRRRRND